MKKILFFSLVVITAACCGSKKNDMTADKIIANPAEFAGKEVSFIGKAKVDTTTGKICVFGTVDSTKCIAVKMVEGEKCCPTLCCKKVNVVGTVTQAPADSTGAVTYFVLAKSIDKAACCKGKHGNCSKKEQGSCAKPEAK